MGIAGGTGFPLDEREPFGIEGVIAVNRSTGLPYGEIAIVGDASFNFAASSVDNMGGGSLSPSATEITAIDPTVTFTMKEWADWAMVVFFGASVNTIAASATLGTVSALKNQVGTSVFSASAGIASATLKTGEAADMKSGWYTVVATSATTVDVYKISMFQANRGTTIYPDSSTNKITSTPLTVVAATAVEVPGIGIELTGGTVVTLVVGDVAYFQVTPPHNGISDVDLGQTGLIFPEHELHLIGKQRANGDTAMVRCYRAQAVSGGTIPFSQANFASTEITIKLLKDRSVGKVASFRFAKEII